MAKRVSFHPGEVKVEFLPHSINPATAVPFQHSESEEKRLIQECSRQYE